MRIVFIGCVESSRRLLETLLAQKKEIVGVITKAHSAINADYADLSELCSENDIDCFFAGNINDADSIQFIREKQPDIIYCFGWSQLIKKEILELPPNGVIGFHPADLPNNRGRHPLIWALVLGLSSTASTFFLMDEGADTGAILSKECVEIRYTDDAQILYDRVMKTACQQVIAFTEQLEQGTCQFLEQLCGAGNAWRKRGKSDGQIDWRMSSQAIYNLVRGLSHPYVGAHFVHQNQEYKVWKTEEICTDEYKNIEPGKVLRVVSETEFYVKAYDNLIHVLVCDPIKLTEGVYLDETVSNFTSCRR